MCLDDPWETALILSCNRFSIPLVPISSSHYPTISEGSGLGKSMQARWTYRECWMGAPTKHWKDLKATCTLYPIVKGEWTSQVLTLAFFTCPMWLGCLSDGGLGGKLRRRCMETLKLWVHPGAAGTHACTGNSPHSFFSLLLSHTDWFQSLRSNLSTKPAVKEKHLNLGQVFLSWFVFLGGRKFAIDIARGLNLFNFIFQSNQ